MPFLPLAARLTIHYLDHHPSGRPTILLLHGLGATCESWELQLPALIGAGFRVIAPDARGFGKSTYPGKSHRVADMANDMADLLTAAGDAQAYVVGISMGGVHALQLALDHPKMVARLVLVNTFASLRPDKLDVWLYFAFRFLLVHTLGLPTQARAVAQRIFPRPDQEMLRQILIGQICQADPRGYRATMRALALFDVRRRLGEIQCPTLVITGADDSTVPTKTQGVLASQIVNARQVVIPAAGHAVIAEQPEAFNQALLEFLV